MRLRKNIVKYLSVTLLVAVAILCAWSTRRGTQLSIEVSSSVGGRFQVFWRKSGQGFSEARSFSHVIPKGDKVSRLAFTIPAPWLSEIRLDPSAEAGDLRIYSIQISSFLTSRTVRGKELLTALHPLRDITAAYEEDGGVLFRVNGNDPILVTHVPVRLAELFFVLSLIVVSFVASRCRSTDPRGLVSAPYFNGLQRWNVLAHRSILGVLLLGFVASVVLKLHGSSLHMWLRHYPQLFLTQESPLIGTPRPIRSDEWLVYTPGAVSQTKMQRPFSQANPSLGAGSAPLLLGVPTDHKTTLVRPQLWGYFLFEVERGYSWFWSYRIFCCLCGVYLLLRILTQGQTILAMVGSLWFFFSPFVQWWASSTVPELVGNLCLALCSLVYAFMATTRARTVAACLGLVVFGVSFALQIYPPFQIPLAWLGIFLLPTLFMVGRSGHAEWRDIGFKVALVSLAAISTLSCIVWHLVTIRESLSILSQTAYPGARSVQGGGVSLARYFLGLAGLLMSEQSVPEAVGNISEGSTFLLVWPIAMATAFFSLNRFQVRYFSPVAAFLTIFSVYIVWGWPGWLSKLTLMNLVPSERAFIGVGLANVLFTMMVIAVLQRVSRASVFVGLSLVVGIGGLFPLYGEAAFGEFLDRPDYILCILVLLALGVPLVFRHRSAFAAAVLVVSIVSAGSVNPVVRGLAPLVRNHVTEAVADLPEYLRERTWLVYGGFILPQLFKASGLEVVNGSKFVPQLDLWSRMDRNGRYRDVYNRYAHFQFQPQASGEPFRMDLVQADLVTVTVSPCSTDLERAGIDVVVLPQSMGSTDVSCMTRVPSSLEQRGFTIFVRGGSDSSLGSEE